MTLSKDRVKDTILTFQKNEITEHFIYRELSRRVKDGHNRAVLKKISDEELRHYDIWSKYSGEEVKPDNIKKWVYLALSSILGVSFCIKLLEKAEGDAQEAYNKVSGLVPEAEDIHKEEIEHENRLVKMIEEDRLNYIGSVVLGLNDALVEFTGALAGFTFALRSSRLIGMVGLIMGFSASLSMAASEYLSTKAEGHGKSPFKASIYTGVAYAFTVLVLVLPYFIIRDHRLSLLLTITLAVILIMAFTFYYSVIKEILFKNRFLEMLAVSMGVAALSFLIGLAVKRFLGTELKV
jgi:VIT1/CCC1 family predicted Fe2+/Mn2+ transporter